MIDPFLIEGPAVIAFSGGRTSGLMLYKIIEAYGGKLPDDVIPVFCNTGKEHERTLDFVKECGERWDVTIRWIEYRDAEESKDRWIEVTYDTASREGEPFEALIRYKNFLPNPVTRFCTTEMKIRATHRLIKSWGWGDWTKVVGLRFDEPGRVAKGRARADDRPDEGILAFPLYDARLTVHDVTAFWGAQPFDLGLPNHNGTTPMGNCDLCFLKGAGKIKSIIAMEPKRAEWWVRMETIVTAKTTAAGTFRADRPSYAAMLAQGTMFTEDEDTIDCACTD